MVGLDFYSLLKMCDGGIHTKKLSFFNVFSLPFLTVYDLFRGNVQELLANRLKYKQTLWVCSTPDPNNSNVSNSLNCDKIKKDT